jgi:CheY-like chemotaxis protein
VPIIVVSSVDDARKGLALGADAYAVKPVDEGWLLATLKRLTAAAGPRVALVVDDDRAARYVLRRQLESGGWAVLEAEDGSAGLRLADETRPDAILLDLVMPGLGGLQVLAALRASPATRHTPVVVATSKALDQQDLDAIAGASAVLLRKDVLSLDDASRYVERALQEAGAAERRAGERVPMATQE